MNRWFYVWVAAGIALAGIAAAIQPLITISILGALIVALIFALVPSDRVALFAGSATITLLITVPVQNISAYGNLKYLVLGAVGALAFGTVARRYESLAHRTKGLWLLIAYFGLIAVATPRSIEPSAWNLLLGVIIAGLAPAIIFAMMNPEERRGIVKFLIGLAVMEAAYALYELAAKAKPLWGYASVSKSGDPDLMYNQLDTALIRSQGTLGHPLPLALLLLVALALVIRGGPNNGLVRALTVAVLFAGCFAAGSRSAMAVALVLIFLGVGRKRWKGLVVGSFLLILGALVAANAGLMESQVFKRFLASSSLSHRTGAAEAVPGLLEKQGFVETVFGNGYFSAYQLFREGLLQTGNFFAVDNQFVMTLVEGGLCGLALLTILIGRALYRIDASARLGLLSVVVFFFSFDVLSWPSGIALFGLFVGLAFSAPAAREDGEKVKANAQVYLLPEKSSVAAEMPPRL